MIKVLQILYSGLGGHGSVAFSFIEGDIHKRVAHSLLFYGIEELRDEYQKKCANYSVPYHSVLKKQGIDMGSYWKVYLALKRSAPDVILMHSVNLILVGVIYGLCHKCKLIAIEHTPNQSKRKSEWIWTILNYLFSSKVVVLSKNYQEELSGKIALFYKSSKTKVIPNGIDLKKFKPNTIENSDNRVLYISMQSRLSKTKDQKTLIKAFKKLERKENLILKIAGGGDTMEDLRFLVNKLGIEDKVIFAGNLNETEVIEFLKNTFIYVHSSLSEVMSTAVMQAMATGLPVVATNIPGINNMISEGNNGLLFKTGDVEELVFKIEMLLNNKELREILSLNARKYAEESFSNEIMFKNYNFLIQDK